MPKSLGLLALLLAEVVPTESRDRTRKWSDSQQDWDDYLESVQESLQAGVASGARKVQEQWSKLKGHVAEESEYWSDYWCGKHNHHRAESLKQEAKKAEKRARELEKRLQKVSREAQQWETRAESHDSRARQAERQRDRLREELKENERSVQEHERALRDYKRSQASCRRDEEKMEELQEVLHRCHTKVDLCEERLAEEKTSAYDVAMAHANCSQASEQAAKESSSHETHAAGAVFLVAAVGCFFLSQWRIRSLTSELERQSRLLATLRADHPGVEDMQGELQRLREEARAKDAHIARMERELHEELGVVSAEAADSEFGDEFSFGVFDERQAGEHLTRTLKIYCPGVAHDDVSVEVIFNGCVVTIARQASFGVQAMNWSRRFQFRLSEGVFELADERARLERGFLHLVFRGHVCPVRIFRFPPHFTMEALDAYSDSWLPSDDRSATGGALRLRGWRHLAGSASDAQHS